MAAAEEFRFKIDAYTPETLPMERLAEYLADLAVLFGENKAVHFMRLEPGSVVPVVKVEREAVPKVRERLEKVRWGIGHGEALRAYRALDRKLREDNAVGTIHEPSGAEIIRFPGREEGGEDFVAVREQGTLDGEVIRLGGKGELIPVTLQSEARTFSHCFAKRPTAKALAHRLFEPVRLFGVGRWTRDRSGLWNLDHFLVDRFEVLGSEALSTVLAGLRSIQGAEWRAGSLAELRDIRQGTDEVQ